MIELNKIDFTDIVKNEKSIKKVKERETWSGRFDFFLAALGYAVGLGAIWRFPYLTYSNGGGVFLIPYFIFLILVGIPLVFLELGAGQFTSTGPLTAWTMIPIFRGLGLCMNIVNGYLGVYYNMIIAYSLYFLVLSLNSELPWEKCEDWSSPNCVSDFSNYTSVNCSTFTNAIKCGKNEPNYGLCISSTYTLNETINSTYSELITQNATCNTDSRLLNIIGIWKPTFPSEDYWFKKILNRSSSISESGSIVWQLVIALFFAWVIVFLTVIKGIKVHGKLVYFTTVFPYVVLLILGIRGWMLEGAEIGIKFYITPNLSRLADIKVWTDAATQIFFTLSVSYGGLIALSSYNNFNNNIMRDAIVVSISNCLTSVFAGFVVFAYMGHLAFETKQEIDQVIQQGQGLAFIVFPYAVTLLAGSPFWSVLFFIMMVIIGLDTMMANVETTITSFLDVFPYLKLKAIRRYSTVTSVCVTYFLIGLVFTLQSGSYWIEIFDTYSGNWAVLIVGLLECISISWFYGLKNFSKDISLMIGAKTTKSFLYYSLSVCWIFITPILLIVLVVFVFKDLKQLDDYPEWSHTLGQILTSSTLSGFFIWAFYLVYKSIFIQKIPLINLFKPDLNNWKPHKNEHLHFRDLKHKLKAEEGVDNLAFTYTNVYVTKF